MIRAAFGTPGFKRLFLGLAASMFGDSLLLIVLGMWVKTLTGSNGAAGLTFLWLTLPALLAPLFGYVVDRVHRRTFLVWVNLGTAVGLVPLLFVEDAGDVWLIYGVAFLYGCSFMMIPAALNGLLKDMLSADLLVEANASLSVTKEAFRLVGPLLGALLFATAGVDWVVGLDMVSFVLAAVAIAPLRVVETEPDAEPLHWRAEVVAGVGHLRRTPTLLHATFALAISLLVLGFSESAIYAVLDAFHEPVTLVGPILSAQGAGAIAGGLLAARLIRRWGEPRVLLAGLAAMAAGFGAVAFATAIWHVFASAVPIGIGLPWVIIAYNTMLQKQTPGRLMGRVSAATEVLVTTPQALSIAVGALLVTLVDYRLIFAVMMLGTFAAAGYLAGTLRGRLGPVAEAPTAEVEPDPVTAASVAPVSGGPGSASPPGPVSWPPPE